MLPLGSSGGGDGDGGLAAAGAPPEVGFPRALVHRVDLFLVFVAESFALANLTVELSYRDNGVHPSSLKTKKMVDYHFRIEFSRLFSSLL